jgi:hypothetical protein
MDEIVRTLAIERIGETMERRRDTSASVSGGTR